MLFLFVSFCALGQRNDSLFLTPCNSLEIEPANIKIYLLGETHYQKNNENLQLSYLKQLNQLGIYPKYLVIERGPASAYIINKYLKTGDEKLLELLFAFNYTRDFYRQVFNFHRSLPDERKFFYVGPDYEDSREFTHYAIRDILLAGLEKNDYSLYKKVNSSEDYLNSDNEFENLLVSIKLKKRPDMWEKKNVNKDIFAILDLLNSRDSSKLIDILGSKLVDLKKITKAYEIPLKNPHVYSNKNNFERDKHLSNEIYCVYKEDTTAVILAQLGAAHVAKSYKSKWFGRTNFSTAFLLNRNNEYSMLNNKVFSSIIIYKTVPKILFKLLNISKSEIKSIFNSMKNCKLVFKKYYDRSTLDQIIYLNDK